MDGDRLIRITDEELDYVLCHATLPPINWSGCPGYIKQNIPPICQDEMQNREPCSQHSGHNLVLAISCLKQFSGVAGSLVVDLGGRILASDLQKSADEANLAVWALGVYRNTFRVAKELGQQRVHQIVFRTEKSCTFITDKGSYMIITTCDAVMRDTLIAIMRCLTSIE
jgi:predicted regulator of Ras-like GTPase activity (Roadblock/LC7/MglB family)